MYYTSGARYKRQMPHMQYVVGDTIYGVYTEYFTHEVFSISIY